MATLSDQLFNAVERGESDTTFKILALVIMPNRGIA